MTIRRGFLAACVSLLAASLWAQTPASKDGPIVPDPGAIVPAEPVASPTPAPSASPSAAPAENGTPAFETSTRPGIYISDTGNHRIIYMKDIEGSERKVLGRAGREPGYFLHPTQIWVDPNGLLFVADRDNNRVIRMNAMNGYGWKEIGGLNHPEGVASRGDEVYVSDTGNDQILVYQDIDKPAVRTLKDPKISRPTGLWLDQNKDLYVTCGQDPPGGRVVKIGNSEDPSKWEVYEGQNLRQLGFAPTQMVTHKRHLWIVDAAASRVVRVDNLAGRAAREWGGYGSALGKFRSPSGLALAEDGTFYVADSGNDRIVAITGSDPKEWKVYSGSREAVPLRNPCSVFSWCPVPKPPPPPEEDEEKKK
jgi:DNA-binding beta-propeller fold protein YncE